MGTEHRGTPVFLRQIRVINWHSIYDRTIDVPNSGLLVFGTNGSGKTSLQDAVQFALFPDAGKVRFNAAVASSTTDRNLLGYVLQKVDEQQDKRPVYKWTRRITYVSLLFERGRERQAFIIGIDANDMGVNGRFHATLPRVPDLAALPLMDERRQVLPLEALERHVRSKGGHAHESVTSYIQELSRYMGSPHGNWPQLMKSVIGFKEIKDATDFVRRFLEEQKIDHASLTRIVESYEALRQSAEDTERWIKLLAGAVGPVPLDESGRPVRLEERPALHLYRHYRSNALKYEFARAVVPRMRVEQRLNEELLPAIAGFESQIEEIGRKLEAGERRRSDVAAEFEQVDARLRDLGITQQINTLGERIREAKADVDRSTQASTGVAAYLGALLPLVEIVASSDVLRVSRDEDSHLARCALMTSKGVHQVTEFANSVGKVDLRSAGGFSHLAEEGEHAFNSELHRLGGQQDSLRTTLRVLEDEEASLRKGRPIYPAGTEAARALLRDKLSWRDARPLCEMLEVPPEHDEWRLAVEAELGLDRHDFVIPPHLYEGAMTLYEQYREKGYTGDDGRRQPLYRISFIDVGKIRQRRVNRSEEASLARKVVTDNDDAADYIAYKLGRVHCEYDTRRLREHQHAITPALIYYRGFKLSSFEARRIDLLVGTHARVLRLAHVEQEIGVLRSTLEEQNRIAGKIAAAFRILRKSNMEFATFKQDVNDSRDLTARQVRVRDLEDQLRRVRENEQHQSLITQWNRLEGLLTDIAQERERNQKEKTKADTRLDGFRDQADRARREIEDACRAEHDLLATIPIEERGLAKASFEEDLRRRNEETNEITDEVLRSVYNTAQRQAVENHAEATKAQMAFERIQVEYRQQTGFQTLATLQDPEPLISEYRRLKDTYLPEQRESLVKKSREMREGIIQGVLHTLGSLFLSTRRLVDDINKSMIGVETRMGRFKIEVKPKKEWLDIYELAKASMSVLSIGQLEYADAEDPFIQESETFMKRFLSTDTDRNELSDYRNYLEFEVLNCPTGGNSWTVFRGTRQGSSGGERQVPFYVMTFALMDHVYRQGAHAKYAMGRLLLMDEVFHNMSDDNVSDVMTLSRKLGLQILMVTPGKLRTLAPLFGKTIQVAKAVIHPSEPSRFIEWERQDLPEDLLNFDEYESETGATA